jgi:hypothetical protein
MGSSAYGDATKVAIFLKITSKKVENNYNTVGSKTSLRFY